MSTLQEKPPKPLVEYPDSDGRPMADNTRQYEWNTSIKYGLESLFEDRPDVFVAGDLLWYPLEGDNTTRLAPDAMIVFGRPKGHRGSYKQWLEDDIAPQVVFEVMSPGNRAGEMERKLLAYESFGVEEYIIYDPDRVILKVYLRYGDELVQMRDPNGWKSPLLGCRFDMTGDKLVIYRPDGKRFKTVPEIQAELNQKAAQAEDARLAQIQAQQRVEGERLARIHAEERAENAEIRSARLAERLRKLGIDSDADE